MVGFVFAWESVGKMKWKLSLKRSGALTKTAKQLIALLVAMLVLVVVGVAISQSFIGHWIARVVAPPGRGWVGLSGLIYLLADAVLFVVILVAMWLVGHRFDPIARWFGPVVRRFRRRGGWPWRR
jgi:CBS domain containing-hemolysin-like protein